MGSIVANITGNVWKILVEEGHQVEEGQEVAILESMKMEIPIIAEMGGTVKTVKKSEGDFVNEGEVLVELS